MLSLPEQPCHTRDLFDLGGLKSDRSTNANAKSPHEMRAFARYKGG